MSKLKKIKNGEYIGGDKYTVTPDAGGKSRIVFSPDSILTEPTPVGAEILNEMQLNEVYTLDTVRSVDGQKEIYTATLEGFTEFDNPDLNFNLKINSENTNSQTYLRLNNIDYLIECKIGNLKAGSIVYAKKINNTIKIIGNKNFGTNEGDILEGSKLAEILGIEYAGILNNSNQKIAGKGYYDTANKKIYKCTGNTSINYADAAYFIEVSNNDLLGKLQNLAIYAEGSVTPWPGFHVIYDTPYILGNTFNFNIGTYSAPLAKQTLLGTVKTKPTRDVTTSTFCAIPGVGIIGSIVVRVETNGNILIIENTGVDPNYLNSNASYYAEFSYIF